MFVPLRTYIVSDRFLNGDSLIVTVLGVPDGEDSVGGGVARQPGPGDLHYIFQFSE